MCSVGRPNMNETFPKVIILVLNWNRKDFMVECLNSLLSLNYENYQIVVIDNGSEDGSEELIREQFPYVNVIQNGENLGYTGGFNRGIKWALAHDADYILILNNDVKLKQDCLSVLVQNAQDNPSVGILGPVAYKYDRPEVIDSVVYIVEMDHMFSKIFRSKEAAQKYDQGDYYDTFYVQGDALLIKKTVFKKIGLFDPRFFIYWEDTDFCIAIISKIYF